MRSKVDCEKDLFVEMPACVRRSRKNSRARNTIMKTKHSPVSAGVSLILLLVAFSSFGAGGRHFVRGDLPAAVARLSAVENLSATNQLQLAIALPLRTKRVELIAQRHL